MSKGFGKPRTANYEKGKIRVKQHDLPTRKNNEAVVGFELQENADNSELPHKTYAVTTDGSRLLMLESNDINELEQITRNIVSTFGRR